MIIAQSFCIVGLHEEITEMSMCCAILECVKNRVGIYKLFLFVLPNAGLLTNFLVLGNSIQYKQQDAEGQNIFFEQDVHFHFTSS